jgi:glyoxalase family protein
VNFDDPTTYHLYYGDEVGRPGSILTFFPWPDAPRGRLGSGQLTTTSFSIPEGSMAFWMDRLRGKGVLLEGPTGRFDERVLSFSDPDGLRLELVQHDYADGRAGWKEGPVPEKYRIRGFYSVTLTEETLDKTASLLLGTLGFRKLGEERSRVRFEVGDGGPGGFVDVVSSPDVARGFVSVGTVHHVAWRTGDDEQQKAWREEIVRKGFHVTPIIDRKYFHSIYFREPGGVLFEIATDNPGFTVDESKEELGTRLVLPAWLEPGRERIEKSLAKVQLGKTVPAQ